MSLESTVKTLLEELRQISKTETVVGKEIKSGETTIIPVSQIKIGIAGGSVKPAAKESEGIGGGASITPIAFIVVNGSRVQLLPMSEKSTPLSKAIEIIPEILEKFISSKDQTEKESSEDGNEEQKEST